MAARPALSNGEATIQAVVSVFRHRLAALGPHVPAALRTFFGARSARLVLSLQQHSLQVPHLDEVVDLLPTSERAVSLGVVAT